MKPRAFPFLLAFLLPYLAGGFMAARHAISIPTMVGALLIWGVIMPHTFKRS